MAIDANIILQGQTPNYVNALLGGFQAGSAIKNQPAVDEMFQEKLAMVKGQRKDQDVERERQIARMQLQDMALDAIKIRPLLESGDTLRANVLIAERIKKIQQRGGDPSDTMAFRDALNSGQITPQQAIGELDSVLEGARQAGVLEGASGRGIRPGFVGSPQRVTDGGQNYLTGLYQDEYGNVTEKRVPVSGQFVSPLGETAEEQTDRAIDEAGGKRIAQLSADLKIKPEIEKKTTQAREFASAEVQKIIAQQGQLSKIADADAIYRSLTPDKLDLIYGYGEKWYPEFLRSQEGIDLQAQRDQLVGMITLASRKELQGQGPITDSEQVALSQAATALSNPNISPRLAKRYIDDAMDMIYGNAGKPFTPPDRLNAPPPPTGGRQQTLDQQAYEVDF